MSALHSEYYPLEVLKKELIFLEKMERYWTEREKQEYSVKYKDLTKKIKELKECIKVINTLF